MGIPTHTSLHQPVELQRMAADDAETLPLEVEMNAGGDRTKSPRQKPLRPRQSPSKRGHVRDKELVARPRRRSTELLQENRRTGDPPPKTATVARLENSAAAVSERANRKVGYNQIHKKKRRNRHARKSIAITKQTNDEPQSVPANQKSIHRSQPQKPRKSSIQNIKEILHETKRPKRYPAIGSPARGRRQRGRSHRDWSPRREAARSHSIPSTGESSNETSRQESQSNLQHQNSPALTKPTQRRSRHPPPQKSTS